jgi:hypothetical protein
LALSLGIAKPEADVAGALPWVAIAELMPDDLAVGVDQGAPDVAGLIGASVCSRPDIVVVALCCCGWPAAERALLGRPRRCWTWMVRSLALMMPAVTEPSRPSGLPIASTVSPTCILALLPNLAACRPETRRLDHGQVGTRVGADDVRVAFLPSRRSP